MTEGESLRVIAVEALEKHGMNARSALNEFVEAVYAEGTPMAALHKRSETETCGLKYLQRVASELAGKPDSPAPSSAGAPRRTMTDMIRIKKITTMFDIYKKDADKLSTRGRSTK